MNPGDLLFVSGTDWIAKLVKWVTKSKYSHVAVYMGNGQSMEAQAFRTVGLEAVSQYTLYDIIPLPPIDPENLAIGLQWLLQQQGRHYSYWSDFVILMRKLFGILIPWHEDDEIMCARLARDFLFQCGLPIPDEDMSPEDLYEWMIGYRKNTA
jgi:hypothetical protein